MRILSILLGLSMGVSGGEVVDPGGDDAAYPAIERFVQVLETVRKRHPDLEKVGYDRLVNHALEGMLAGLDPHSSFIHPEMMARMKQGGGVEPELVSLGMTLGLRDDGVYVAAVAVGGAAAEAGVLPGAALLEVDGRRVEGVEGVEGVEFEDVVGSLKRAAGERSRLLLKSPVAPLPVEAVIIHRYVESRSIGEVLLLDRARGVGYVRLGSFGSQCGREMEAALDQLEDEGMKALILDLRENGGGDLHETVKILGLLLPPGTAVVTTRGREGEVSAPMTTPERQRRKREYPISILINRMSASASELTAGVVQDLKRGKVYGEVSYGKGSVQNIIPMGGGTALRLTVATYHTPSGNTPHLKGITPDVAVVTSEQDRANFIKRLHSGSLGPEEKKALEGWKDPVIDAALKGF